MGLAGSGEIRGRERSWGSDPNPIQGLGKTFDEFLIFLLLHENDVP